MPHAETPIPFRASLPAYAHAWCWLPVETILLTTALPNGLRGTVFHVWRCPQHQARAWNVAELWP